ncbi:MAG: hypothetical protein ACUVR3_03325 [Candidatus Roseilinea sp.]|uniref:hypothetical protein n=1 Tax=Candidatus Roseilinea sp. TaxID=2838777 RepID=UPI00404B6DB1
MGANVTPLLLPLGIWLMMSAAAPRNKEGQIAASGLLAFALAACAFFAIGFGLMFGGIGAVLDAPGLSRFVTYYTFPVAGQTWGLLGLRGFLLSDATAPEALSLFIAYLPLVATSAMLMAGLMARRSGFIAQTIVISIVSGIIFPIAGFWVWGGGWLAKTGLNLNLGHGVVDLGGLATTGLIAGAAGAVWLLLSPKRQRRVAPDLPPNHFPFRALSGGIFILIGASSFVAGNPLYGTQAAAIAGAYAANLILAGVVAALLALAYSFATTRRADALCAARATLAAVIIVSTGGPLFSAGLAAALGIVAALLATIGMYVVNEVLGWLDDNAVVSTAGLAGAVGLLSVGLFANGSFGAGWNGVGATSFLGRSGLGITGALAFGAMPADPGQFTAQFTAIGAIIAFTVMVFGAPAVTLHKVIRAQYSVEIDEAAEAPGMARSSAPANRLPRQDNAQSLQPVAATQAGAESDDTPPAIPAPATLGELPLHRPGVDVPASGNGSEPADAEPAVAAPGEATPGRSLLDRIRRGRSRPDEQEMPPRARHVAYPSRGAARRVVIRPLIDDQPAQPPATDEN